MLEVPVTRASGNRWLFTLAGVGTLDVGGWASRKGSAEAGGQRWEITCSGLMRRDIEATDAAGVVVGEFRRPATSAVGGLRWSGAAFGLRREGVFGVRYVLVADSRQLATIKFTALGGPGTIKVDEASAIDPGLLLFAVFVARVLAADRAVAAS
ncbi:MAG: hypothetical protein LC749_10140 [Actinobacteria bacterium]|nr:hypothetical protein [Actinomycetota bacterium]